MINKGFTLLELVLAMGIFSIISVASVWLVFLSLGVRDLSTATSGTEESLRNFERVFKQSAGSASTVGGGGNVLTLKNSTDCWSYSFDPISSNLNFDHITAANCVPNPNPSTKFFPTNTKMSNFAFSVIPLPTGGRQISAGGMLTTTLPFNSFMEAFSTTVTNVID